MENNYNVKAVERALELLKCFSVEHPEWSLAELSAAMELNKSTVFRMATTLETHHFLKMDPNGKYRLGVEIYRLSAIDGLDTDLRNEAFPSMQSLAALTNETVILARLDDCRGVCVDKIESHNVLKIASQVGSELPLFGGATGKAISAFLALKDFDRCVSVQETIYSTTYEKAKLVKAFDLIRRNGYCSSCNEVDMGVAALAAPIFNYTNTVVGSISVAGPNFRFVPDESPAFIQAIIKESGVISKKLGYGT